MPWSEPTASIALLLVGMLLSAVSTACVRRYALQRGMLDMPSARRSHASPTPRGGGIGIVLVLLLACLWLRWHGSDSAGWFGGGLLLVAMVGWRDDLRAQPAWLRLSGHILAGGCLAMAVSAQGASLGWLLPALLLVPGLANSWNFIDGINGLAATQALLCALALACVLHGANQLLALLLAAACVGFLPFNVPKARIFLGDVGSGSLGYLLAGLLIFALREQPVPAWPVLLLPMMAVLVDTSMTLGWRVASGQSWWQPHVQHVYQQQARRHGHLAVTLAYAVWTLVASVGMCALIAMPLAWVGSVGMLAIALLAWWHWHERGEGCSQ